jgi:hypothetical protein
VQDKTRRKGRQTPPNNLLIVIFSSIFLTQGFFFSLKV